MQYYTCNVLYYTCTRQYSTEKLVLRSFARNSHQFIYGLSLQSMYDQIKCICNLKTDYRGKKLNIFLYLRVTLPSKK